jgi:parvulin-like peptidyl-prolyl isomerase
VIILANKKDKNKPAVKRRKFSKSYSKKSKQRKRNFNNLKILGVLLLLIIAVFLLLNKSKQTEKDIAAKVNGEEITKEYIEEQYNQIPESYKSTITKEIILNQSINEKLLLQEADKQGIITTDKEVSETINQLMEDSGLSEQEFQQTLDEQGITMDFLEDYYKKQITINKLLNKTVVSKVSVSEQEINDYYENNKGQFIVPEKVNASHILVNTTEEAEEILKLLEEGGDFAELARQRSMCTSAPRGGNLGYFVKGTMVKEFEDAAFSLDIGEMSNIVESSFGYHIIKVHDKKPETVMSLEDSASFIREKIKLQKQNKILGEYLNQLRDNADIEILYDFN